MPDLATLMRTGSTEPAMLVTHVTTSYYTAGGRFEATARVRRTGRAYVDVHATGSLPLEALASLEARLVAMTTRQLDEIEDRMYAPAATPEGGEDRAE